MPPTQTITILRQHNEWRLGNEDLPQHAPKQITAAIDAAVEMIERLKATEKEREEFKRACFGHISDNSLLRAKIAEMEHQKPVAWARKLGMDLPSFGCVTDLKYRPSDMPESAYMPLYALPGAQPAPSIPSTELRPVIEWLRNGCDPMKAADELEMLAAAPESKP